MTLAVSSWGGDYDMMKWLDGDTGCQGSCSNNASVKLSNIKVASHPSPSKPVFIQTN